ncbi:response regulator [Metabacillus fastidiosus]|uniref:histidine kinase n=1 Tax=Metabacillus fastidiosus TaxID=1458 RepID=A0ABU6P390_9BACI|nr:response regulator [Metabacillus fastidiosus]MED4403540.1 ATP-binding protein [Metabacillus fastidiosus]MED4455670.1 ATP-binding protein [Metabacillus fastidiosus]MED4463734.1 ATP-binding protein [Metabacillus fastidiosus]
MKFKTKLYLGFGFILSLFIVLLVILMMLINQLNHNMNITVQNYEYSKLATTIQASLNIYSRESKGLVANPPAKLVERLEYRKNKALDDAEHSIRTLQRLDKREESQELTTELLRLAIKLRENEADIKRLEDEGKKEEAMDRFWFDNWQIIDAMILASDELHEIQETSVGTELKRSSDTYNLALNLIIAFAIIGFLTFLFLIVLVVRSITNNLNKVTDVMTNVEFGSKESLPRIEMGTNDEIGAISTAYNEMARAIEEHTKKEKELKNIAEEQSWLQSRIAEIATMYSGIEQIEQLAQQFIMKLTPMVGASYGVFYMKEYEENEEKLVRLASYAYSSDSIGKKVFKIGEGIVGQTALENNMIHLTNIPEDYIKITSGIGEAAPKSILTIPAAYEGEVLAVIELASFESFSSMEQLLIKEVTGNIGINIKSISRHNQVKKLLLESQALTEELQTQSEELHLQQEELRQVNEQLEQQYEQSEEKTRELEETKKVLEEQAQQLKLSSKYKSEFLANMSHELRTPLNSLLILAQILSENGERNLTLKQIEYAKTIFSSGNDLLHLINDILDLAKVEAGKMEIHFEEVKLGEIKSFVESQFTHIAKQKNIEFIIQIDSDLPGIIWTDQHRLQQILKNLLSNAFKFTEEGTVTFIIERKSKGLGESNHFLDSAEDIYAFSVKDTGVGISPEHQTAIFEAFNQLDGTTSRKYGGTGLGLSISKEIAELLEGSIEVESEKGKGTTFTLYIPNKEYRKKNRNYGVLQEVAVGSLVESYRSVESVDTKLLAEDENEYLTETFEEIDDSKELLRGKKILVVDDDMRNIFAITTALEIHDVEVVFAENGKEGIERLTEHPDVDLILMDIMMPEMDGLQAIRAIRQMEDYEDMPIIVLTAKAMKDDRVQCIEAGASDYISKPVNLDQLFSLMWVWLYR